ncbi:MAG TPA: hypothetical protein VF285_05450 [Castellaniella sp.]
MSDVVEEVSIVELQRRIAAGEANCKFVVDAYSRRAGGSGLLL